MVKKQKQKIIHHLNLSQDFKLLKQIIGKNVFVMLSGHLNPTPDPPNLIARPLNFDFFASSLREDTHIKFFFCGWTTKRGVGYNPLCH